MSTAAGEEEAERGLFDLNDHRRLLLAALLVVSGLLLILLDIFSVQSMSAQLANTDAWARLEQYLFGANEVNGLYVIGAVLLLGPLFHREEEAPTSARIVALAAASLALIVLLADLYIVIREGVVVTLHPATTTPGAPSSTRWDLIGNFLPPLLLSGWALIHVLDWRDQLALGLPAEEEPEDDLDEETGEDGDEETEEAPAPPARAARRRATATTDEAAEAPALEPPATAPRRARRPSVRDVEEEPEGDAPETPRPPRRTRPRREQADA